MPLICIYDEEYYVKEVSRASELQRPWLNVIEVSAYRQRRIEAAFEEFWKVQRLLRKLRESRSQTSVPEEG